MRKLGIGLLIAVAAYAAWSWIYPTYTYRYRMTVEVEAGGKVHSGASVIEVAITKQPQFGSAPPQVSRVYGDAVFVDLGGGRNVIALLASGPNADDVDYPYNVIPELFGLTFNDRDLAKLSGLRGKHEIPANFLPTLVTFSDLNDPKTARVVQPHEFPEVFGEGIRFRRATVEITRDAVTRGIASKLPLLDKKPFPWLTPMGNGVYADTRSRDTLRWHTGHLIRDY